MLNLAQNLRDKDAIDIADILQAEGYECVSIVNGCGTKCYLWKQQPSDKFGIWIEGVKK
jgi:hypothetical protein